MTRRLFLWSAALAGLLLTGRPATAQVLNYVFADNNGVAQTSFSVAVGATVPIRVYIQDPSAGATLLNSNGGLGSGSVRVTYNTPAGVADIQNAAAVTPATPPWAFGNVIPGSGAQANTMGLANGSPTSSGVLPDASGRVLLGTFTFRGLAGGSVTLRAVDLNAGGGDTTSFNPVVDYDPFLQAGTATLTVTPVPEPGSLALVGMAAAGLVAYRRRRAATATA